MNPLKALWGLLFRVFPCPTPTGLRKVGAPDRHSPVLVTCNFHTTVARLTRWLARRGVNAWILVADSKGVNVWCAAGGDELSTDTVTAVVKTSGIAELVDHRTLVLPPLGAPGIDAAQVAKRTGWKTRWGPVRYHDLPEYLAQGQRRTEPMKRATYRWSERLDTALGSLFPFYLIGALGFLLLGRSLLLTYLIVGAIALPLFYLPVLWLPGRRGLVKVLPLVALAAGALTLSYTELGAGMAGWRAALIIGMVMLVVYATELGGIASTLPSDLDPFLAKLGIGAIGNSAFAGTVRTELLIGDRTLRHDPTTCNRCRTCVEICPQGVWVAARGDDGDGRIQLAAIERCTACRACLTNCPTEAIAAIAAIATVGRESDSR